jgi:CheY-like chemotaxis protein
MTTEPLVCIVDDAADYRLILKHVFSHHFPAYSVRFFVDGQDFLNKFPYLNPLPNLILLDQHMPHLDGHQTLLWLKEHPIYKKIPVVMMSADASALEIDSCYEAGVNSFLSKSLDFDAMREQMEMVCQYWLVSNLKPVQMA